jgi:hypothetical protein
MTEVADYKVIRDVKFTLPNDHDGIDKDFVFTLPSDFLPGVPELPPGVLSWVMVGSSPSGAAKYSFTLNDTKIIEVLTPPDPHFRVIQETLGSDVILHSGPLQNTLTLRKTDGPTDATVEMSDIVLWFHRNLI